MDIELLEVGVARREAAFERLGTHRDLYGLPIDQLIPAAFKRARG